MFSVGVEASMTTWKRSVGDDHHGAILVCDVVYAELVPAFGDRGELDKVRREIGASPAPLDTTIAYEASMIC